MEKDIKDLTVDELTNPGFIESIYENYQETELRNEILNEIMVVAKERKVLGKVKKEISKYDSNFGALNVITDNSNLLELLDTNNNGRPIETTRNYEVIMNSDHNVNNLFLKDSFSNTILKVVGNGFKYWSDSDDSSLRVYLETNYGLYNQQKYYDAFSKVADSREFHPIKYLIEKDNWDGVKRIDNFLSHICSCPNDDYHREVSRMIFYGGISRIYSPGCKFDYMPIFISSQGVGKSTIIRWLALRDEYFTEINSIEGKDALEQLNGSWICEFAELLAMVRTKEVEAMKGFISRTSDKYRRAYARRTSEHPRHCIFIGTTNDYNFLIDKTGNRRYLPVELNLKQGELFSKEGYVKEYILQCWREALYLFNNDKTYLTIPSQYQDVIKESQEKVMQDDPRTGLIEDYLSKKSVGDKVCGVEIFTKCLNGIRKNFAQSEAKEMSRYMSYHKEWKRCDRPVRFQDYGPQRAWEKIDSNNKWSDLD